MTVKGGTSPARAVCKYQRRKCSSDCPLAPYFPANQPKTFQNIHRLFGASNITNMLGNLETNDQKEDAMKSIIYESDMRERFPVYGCSVIISQLRLQLQHALEELWYIYAQLETYRQQFNKQSTPYYTSSPQIEFGIDPSNSCSKQCSLNKTVDGLPMKAFEVRLLQKPVGVGGGGRRSEAKDSVARPRSAALIVGDQMGIFRFSLFFGLLDSGFFFRIFPSYCLIASVRS
ncbi:unnamed protein product [Fraxinus pennsylvanica]|uniref:LOB domain-containing protein n=1 Tax=Fraxinus pennsylvanica TaxID=56036 RepID=A0AAD2DP73_9LAMI|nr:unnamed protein product [Fraxinus pennsylvanica]